MSFIRWNGAFVRDMWAGVPVVSKDPTDLSGLRGEDVVPETLNDILTWAYVEKVEGTHKYLVLYEPSDPTATACQVTIRLQGYVFACQLSALGDWDRTETGAARAEQTLTLHAGGQKEPYMAQLQTVNNLFELIRRSVDARSSPGAKDRLLLLQRRVFDKNTSSDAVTLPAMPGESRRADAAKIKHAWTPKRAIEIAVQREDNKIVLANRLLVRRGDFVDVTATFDVFTLVRDRRRELRVYMSMQRIIRLKEQAWVSEPKEIKAGTSAPPAKSVPVKETFAIDDVEGMMDQS
ncbi:hypothetical protein PsYK624_129430 [Phanerochaete sordida]|uniref:Uncharacterized protein n=1 Tax=Phanerochaete sordida TaxID=48140 RepID=A0A9P3GK76_9APHY|nr:hypothetical protein PsYK624_129430 [Phanerochaete sordida]